VRTPRVLLLLLPCACAAPPPAWSEDATATLAAARRDGADLAVFFALPGRDQSDRMERTCLHDAAVERVLVAGGFRSLWLDGFAHRRMYEAWIGGGEGMGVCVLDGNGTVYAARPGPQDPPELAAFLTHAAQRRRAVASLRAALAQAPSDPTRQYDLGLVLLELGCRIGTEELLLSAAQGGVLDANHRLARLYALDGRVERAREWLRTLHPTPAARVTEAYVLFKERRSKEAADAFASVLRDGGLDDGALADDKLRARLYLGKSLHECGRDDDARTVLTALAADAAGTTFGAAARHTLGHMQDNQHDHSH
jgi:hypothetical protein